MANRILLIEDDAALGKQVAGHLERAGFAVTWWTEGRRIAAPNDYALVVLDLMLPEVYGMDILKALRESSDVPVLILSARSDTFDKIRALKLGADDYMTKPFWPEELVERVRARVRRPTMARSDALQLGGLTIDAERHVVEKNGAPVELTRVEFNLLALLAGRAGEAVSRQTLVEKALDPDRDGTERTLDVHVSRLRKKLGDADLIQTVWGIGYRLRGEK